MSAIDKTYLKNYNDYASLKQWCINQGLVTDDYGNKFRPVNFLIELTEDEWNSWMQEQREHALKYYDNPEHTAECKKMYGDDWKFNPDDYCEIPIWNTPKYFDIWLIRNCPFEFIQERLKEQYGDGWSKNAFSEETGRTDYEAIRERDSVWDHYTREGLKNPHFSIKWRYKHHWKDDDNWWWITVEDSDGHTYWYNDDDDSWVGPNELHPHSSNVCHRWGYFSKRRVYRMLRKWNLPAGTKVKISISYRRYEAYQFEVVLKK